MQSLVGPRAARADCTPVNRALGPTSASASVLTVGISRAAAVTVGGSFQGFAHNQIEPRYNRRDGASAACRVGWPSIIIEFVCVECFF